ncbi:MAG: hypothetical protein AAB209_02870 [Bacteroidota bacterium]
MATATKRESKKRVSKQPRRRNGQPRQTKEVPFISFYDLTRDLCGSVASGIPDLASNKKHMRGYGRR